MYLKCHQEALRAQTDVAIRNVGLASWHKMLTNKLLCESHKEVEGKAFP